MNEEKYGGNGYDGKVDNGEEGGGVGDGNDANREEEGGATMLEGTCWGYPRYQLYAEAAS